MFKRYLYIYTLRVYIYVVYTFLWGTRSVGKVVLAERFVCETARSQLVGRQVEIDIASQISESEFLAANQILTD